jgi:hypothetical protein
MLKPSRLLTRGMFAAKLKLFDMRKIILYFDVNTSVSRLLKNLPIKQVAFVKLFACFAFVIVFGSSNNVFAQSSIENQTLTETKTNAGPRAVISSEKARTISPMIIQINELTDGDEVLTEKVVAELYKSRNSKIDRIVSDAEFEKLDYTEKRLCASYSEVLSIVEQLKD